MNELRKLLIAGLLAILIAGSLLWYFYLNRQIESQGSVEEIALAARKADALQSAELQSSFTALERNDRNKIIWGDRFLRWTVLAYTIFRLDQGDREIIPEMERLLTLFYNHAWYPYVKNKPEMPFPSLISYFHADGTWEDYWNDYKPVYASAFVLEFYLLSCYDKSWGIQNFPLLKNVTDSIIRMWLPARHQPTAYVDAFKAGSVEVVEIKNITSSVDSSMVYSALVAASELATRLVDDEGSARMYESYANDLLNSFTTEKWDWFPTNIFGSNPSEDYGTALQLGMTVPNLDRDDKIDQYAQIVDSALRVNQDSWLLKWKTSDSDPSSRSVYAAIGLAPKHPEMAVKILTAYAHKALQENPWFTSKTDGYEGEDPIWVSGKFLEAYVFVRQRLILGRTIFSPAVLRGDLTFQTSLAPGDFELRTFNATISNLYGSAFANAQVTKDRLYITFQGFIGQKVVLTFLAKVSSATLTPDDIQSSRKTDSAKQTITVIFVPDSRPVTITLTQGS